MLDRNRRGEEPRTRVADSIDRVSGAALFRVRDVGLALLALALGCALVKRFVALDSRGALGATLAEFAGRKDEIDALLLGSSHFRQGFDTALLERELAAEGLEFRAFNCGVPGLRSLEQGFLLEHLLAQQPARLKWVVLEAGPIRVDAERDYEHGDDPTAITARAIQSRSFAASWRALAAIHHGALPLSEKVVRAGRELELLARNQFNVGVLADRLGGARRAARQERAGVPLELDAESGARERAQRAQARAERNRAALTDSVHRAVAQQVAAGNRERVSADELDLGFHPWLERAAARAGARVVYVTAPSATASTDALSLAELGELSPLIHLNDPERFPELFQLELRRDLDHLNPLGAERFSRLFAAEFAKLVRAERGVR